MIFLDKLGGDQVQDAVRDVNPVNFDLFDAELVSEKIGDLILAGVPESDQFVNQTGAVLLKYLQCFVKLFAGDDPPTD